MNILMTVILVIFIYIFGTLMGLEVGRDGLCKTLNAEYYNGTCMKVERKQVIISNENNKEIKL